ncbi:MAG: hypothetical protein ACRETF_02415 [Nevskiaceae bacterium]
MVTKAIAAFSLLAAVMAPAATAAEREHHGYGGGGLMLSTSTTDTPLGDVNTGGAGVAFTGAGLFNVAPIVGIGVTGGLMFGARADDDSDEDIGEAQVALDGGVVLADIVYLSLGFDVLSFTPESTDVTFSYAVVPLGIGVFKATDSGYLLAQLRFGGGELSDDSTNFTQDVGFFGIRLAGQIGKDNGVQFLGGMELNAYDYKDVDVTDTYFRVFFGVGFGT